MTELVLNQYARQAYQATLPGWLAKHAALFTRLMGFAVAVFFIALTVGAVWLGYMQPVSLLAALALIASAGLILSYLAARPVLHPRRTQPKFTPSDFGVARWEEILFSAADGVELGAWFVPPDPKGDGSTVVFVHGLGGNRGDLLTEAAVLTSRGYGALLIDLRNHGRSRGSITTLGYSEVDDVRGAVEYLLARPEVNPARIGLFGHSMGGATVLRAAARIPQVRAVIAASAYANLKDNIAHGIATKTGLPPYPFAPLMIWLGERMTGVRIEQIRPVDDVVRLAPRAVLFIHGMQDDTVDVQNALRLYDAACEPKSLYLVQNASHTGLLFANPQEFERRVGEFLDRNLRGIRTATPSLPVTV
jgi:uncharacterized protein